MGRVQSERPAGSKKLSLIFDATPIIYLCKVNLAKHLVSLGNHYRICTTREVYKEVNVHGLQESESAELTELFEGGIEVLESKGKVRALLKSSGLPEGEIAVLDKAKSLGGTAIVDDKRARVVGKAIGVSLAGTVTIIMEFVKLGLISKDEAKYSVGRMIEEGWYCSAKDYMRMIEAVESL